ncbi:hypothetical protein [Arthrobacter bambusae]|uniref:hypothetical protein n=1 Tax=Arthrobacter bambusae TaxID=1338426 RepID=UPI0027839EBB|nr:hypothetical protein [Arthrobacter bambusae]MDQ0212572.1 hypothetical protein [Arthrobacter bambusae]MDQ0236954.1 hypothetical protein [Arthrobacter bambusae]
MMSCRVPVALVVFLLASAASLAGCASADTSAAQPSAGSLPSWTIPSASDSPQPVHTDDYTTHPVPEATTPTQAAESPAAVVAPAAQAPAPAPPDPTAVTAQSAPAAVAPPPEPPAPAAPTCPPVGAVTFKATAVQKRAYPNGLPYIEITVTAWNNSDVVAPRPLDLANFDAGFVDPGTGRPDGTAPGWGGGYLVTLGADGTVPDVPARGSAQYHFTYSGVINSDWWRVDTADPYDGQAPFTTGFFEYHLCTRAVPLPQSYLQGSG